jgi:Family of unknown function (DUF6941)
VPELDFAILADRVSTDGGVGYVMRGGIDTINAQEVPIILQIGLLIRVGFTRQECGRPHRFEVIFQDEDGQRLMQTSTVLEPAWDAAQPAHWRVNVLGALNFAVPLTRHGLYSFEILINDSNVKTIQVRAIEPPGE